VADQATHPNEPAARQSRVRIVSHEKRLALRPSLALEWNTLRSRETSNQSRKFIRLPGEQTIGLFLDWECPTKEVKLCPGDVLIICTDGVTESPNPNQEEYGEGRLMEVVQENRTRPVHEILKLIQEDVQKFSGPTQADDITLIVGRLPLTSNRQLDHSGPESRTWHSWRIFS
jgi:serine/threonine protein phosphatase PrpC